MLRFTLQQPELLNLIKYTMLRLLISVCMPLVFRHQCLMKRQTFSISQTRLLFVVLAFVLSPLPSLSTQLGLIWPALCPRRCINNSCVAFESRFACRKIFVARCPCQCCHFLLIAASVDFCIIFVWPDSLRIGPNNTMKSGTVLPKKKEKWWSRKFVRTKNL